MGTSEKPLTPKTNRKLVVLMTACAITAAAVRLGRENINASVFVQLALSFFAVMAAGIPFPDDAPRTARVIRSLSLAAFAAALLVSPYGRMRLFAPFASSTLLFFAVWVGYERFGKRMLWTLLLLVPLGAWATFEVRASLERRRLAELDEPVTLAPDR